ncbi:MAG TPA: hypothetical protein VEA38_01610 [Terriglobales bacterium]|nr:hypothetical protein [Terriglobales bacterium]
MAKRRSSADDFVRDAGPDARVLAGQNVELRAENARLSKVLGLVEAYRAKAGDPPAWLRPKRKPRAGQATAVMQLSDLHLDELVNPSEMNGLNAYSREIAELRLKRWADKACDMGDRFRHEWDGALVILGGDMVSGAIHDELRETNEDVLPGTLRHWAPRLAAALRQVADFYGRLHLPAIVGNHGRLTVKMQAKRRALNSWDGLLYTMIQMHLAGDERITWDVAGGSLLYVPVYGRHIGVTHGDEVGGGGGWVGIFSPLGTIHRRLLEIAPPGVRMSYAAVHHWHQLVQAHSRGFALNGSLKGFDEYALALRFRPEQAQQSWAVETPEHGVTLAGPLLVEDRKREGW